VDYEKVGSKEQSNPFTYILRYGYQLLLTCKFPEMIEPLNSNEVSYVILLKKPKFSLGTSIEKLANIIGNRRCKELSQWSDKYYCYRWLQDHTVSRGYLIPFLRLKEELN
jgi:hypothetical protein